MCSNNEYSKMLSLGLAIKLLQRFPGKTDHKDCYHYSNVIRSRKMETEVEVFEVGQLLI